MPIYDQGYERWEGQLQSRPLRWWPIVRQGVLQFLPKRKYLIMLMLAWLGPLYHGALLFGKLKATGTLQDLLGQLGMDAGPGFFFTAIDRQGLWVLLFVVMVGSDLIASDRRFNALQLYFSKPLTPNDYIFGKLGIVGGFLLMVIWLPILLLWLFGLMVRPELAYLKEIWWVPLAVTAYAALLIAVSGLLILALSSVGRRGVYIAGAWLILFGYGPFQLVTLLLKGISGNEYWGLIGLHGDLQQVGSWFFGVDGPNGFHPAFSLAVLAAVIVACYAVIRRRIEPVEVVL